MVEANPLERAFRTLGITGELAAILMIVFGIAILIRPELVGILIGIYLVVVGLIQLAGYMPAIRARMAGPSTR